MEDAFNKDSSAAATKRRLATAASAAATKRRLATADACTAEAAARRPAQ